jgi:MTH538 TIR-like domain (DUF1863)
MNAVPTIGDSPSSELADRLRRAAVRVKEPQLSRIVNTLPQTVFVSHSSMDDAFIKGADETNALPQPGSIWWIIGSKFPDPFYHSRKTGGAHSYERIVGLALTASKRVLIVWSENALRSDYVRAEILIAMEGGKKVAAYLMPNAPSFPIAGVEVIHDCDELGELLKCWKKAH